jgi:hypothetical protein
MIVTDAMVEAALDSWWEGHRWRTWSSEMEFRTAMRDALTAALSGYGEVLEALRESGAAVDRILRGDHTGWDQALSGARAGIDAVLAKVETGL